MSERNPIRYTVVYEGDPAGARILNGQPAPGRAVGVMLGDLFEKYDAEDKKADALIAAAESRAASAEAEVERLKAKMADTDWVWAEPTAMLHAMVEKGLRVEAAEASASALKDRVAVLESALKSILKPFPAVTGPAEDMLEDWMSAVSRFRATARAALKESSDCSPP